MKRLFCLLAIPLWLTAGFYSGSETVATSGTAVPLSAATPAPPAACVALTVTWNTGNAGTIYIGGANVSAANKIGAYINASFPSAYFAPSSTLPLYTTATIWIDAVNSGDKVSVTCAR